MSFSFVRDSTMGMAAPCLHGTAVDKTKLFIDRYTLLQQVCMKYSVIVLCVCTTTCTCSFHLPCHQFGTNVQTAVFIYHSKSES
jgi:hypothetical protein